MNAQKMAQVVADASKFRGKSSQSITNILSGLVDHGEIVGAYLDIKPGEHRTPERAVLSRDPIPLVLVTADGNHVKIFVDEYSESEIIKEKQPIQH